VAHLNNGLNALLAAVVVCVSAAAAEVGGLGAVEAGQRIDEPDQGGERQHSKHVEREEEGQSFSKWVRKKRRRKKKIRFSSFSAVVFTFSDSLDSGVRVDTS
jgi:hypothetical protein